MEDSFVSSIPELDGVPAGLIEERLPDFLLAVGRAIHDPAVAQNDHWLRTANCDLREDVFQAHLEPKHLAIR